MKVKVSDSGSNQAAGADRFVTTRWTQVLEAQGDSGFAQEALSELCAAYYSPVVAFLRREGRDEDQARELAHEFFAGVLGGHSFAADPARGRFRSYLLGALKHFLAKRRAHAARAKRGGNVAHEPLEELDAIAEPGSTAEANFDREWALRVLDRAMIRLKAEWVERGALAEFEKLKPWLTAERGGEGQSLLARESGMNEGAMRVRLHRFRRRFGDLVKAEIAQTVNGPGEVAGEMRHLIAALS